MTATRGNAASVRQDSPGNEADDQTERPVRQKLQDATIEEADSVALDQAPEERGRSTRKRGPKDQDDGHESADEALSPNEIDQTATKEPNSTTQASIAMSGRALQTSPERKRTREATDDGEEQRQEEGNGSPKRKSFEEMNPTSRSRSVPKEEGLGSPQGKRIRAEQEETDSTDGPDAKRRPQDEAITKRDADLPGGFASVSTKPSFGAMLKEQASTADSSEHQTSSSAFKASGFASFAKTSVSPFAISGKVADEKGSSKPSFTSLASSSASPFASAGGSSVFGAGTGSSVFGSKSVSVAADSSSSVASGFGKLGGGSAFGSASPFGPPLANSSKASGLSSIPGNLLGASTEADEDGSGDESADNNENVVGNSEDQKDERFFEQQVATGEEDEDTTYSMTAKLLVFEQKEWKERGAGVFKVNRQKASGKKGRLIMRAKGSQKLILNTSIIPSIINPDIPPTRATVLFGAVDLLDGVHKPHTVKVKSLADAKDLFDAVKSCIDDDSDGESSHDQSESA